MHPKKYNMIKDLFTEKDGVSFCPVRAGYIIGFIGILGFTLHDVFFTENFHFMTTASEWIKSLGEYLGMGGAAVGYKNTTEQS